MEYLQSLCFAGVNSKMRDFQQERREKIVTAAVFVSTEFNVSRQTAREQCRNNILCVAKQDIKIGI